MNAAWNDYRTLWTAAFTQRHPGLLKRLVAITLPATLLAAAVGWYTEHDLHAVLQLCVAVPGVLCMACWTLQFVPGAVLLNAAPGNARLVPRMHRRLVQMIVAGWIAALALAFLAAGTWQPVPLVGLYVIGLTGTRAGRSAGILLAMPAMMWSLLQRQLPAAWLDMLGSGTGFALEMLLLAGVAAYAINLMFPAGGDRHFEGSRKQVAAITCAGWRKGGGSNAAPWLKWSLYRLALRRDCRRRSVAALLMHALGPAVHWTLLWWSPALLLGIGLLFRYVLPVVLDVGQGAPGLQQTGWVLVAFLGLVLCMNAEQLAARIGKTRTEQALLRLAPPVPPAPGLNRLLAFGLLRTGMFNWAAVTLSVVALAALGGAGGHVEILLALCSLGGLPLVASQLRDFARDGGRPGWSGVKHMLLAAAVGLPLALAGYLAGMPFWPVLFAAVTACGAVQVALRWRAMMKAPAAFPAGRMA